MISVSFFFFNDTATTEIYTLSLHDALPICGRQRRGRREGRHHGVRSVRRRELQDQAPQGVYRASLHAQRSGSRRGGDRGGRSEEHTSELQSQSNLVCRLLLEKKKHTLEIRCQSKIVWRLVMAIDFIMLVVPNIYRRCLCTLL